MLYLLILLILVYFMIEYADDLVKSASKVSWTSLGIAYQSSDILQHPQNRPTGDRQTKIKIRQFGFQEKVRQIQVVYKNTLPINNTGYGWYIGS